MEVASSVVVARFPAESEEAPHPEASDVGYAAVSMECQELAATASAGPENQGRGHVPAGEDHA